MSELLKEHRRLEALLQALPIGVAFTTTPGCEQVTGNKALFEQFGARTDENVSASAADPRAPGRQVVYLQGEVPLVEGELPLQRAAREGRVIDPVELGVRLPNGKAFSTEVSAAPIRDDAGQVIGAVAISVDITDRKRAMEIREQARLKDEFLAMLGHELRNPLAAISVAVELLASDMSPARRCETDELIHNQLGVLKRLVDDLMDLSHATLGSIRLQWETMSLVELLNTAASAARPLAAQRCQHLALALPDADVHFRGDKVRLQQVLANLLDNATKYAGTGGCIALDGSDDGSDIVLRCRDSGPGIPPELQERIFEPFRRLEPALQATPKGFGIGLAVVQTIARLHGGSIAVSSAGHGSGAEFVVRIPHRLVRAPDGAPCEAPHVPAPALTPARECLRTLLVEDHPALLAVTAELLRSEGLHVVAVPSGRQAHEAALALRPQILLCDMRLQDMSGLELVERLQPQLVAWGTHVVMVSARTEEELKPYCDLAVGLRIAEFAPKPISREWVRAMATQVAEATQAPPELAASRRERGRRLRARKASPGR